MALYESVKNRILIQYHQVHGFESSDLQEINCVRELESEGKVFAAYAHDERGKGIATITALTKHGAEFVNSLSSVSRIGGRVDEIKSRAEKAQIDADRSFDLTLLKMSSVGLGLEFGVLPLLGKFTGLDKWHFICFCLSTSCLAVCVALLLISHVTSKQAFASLAGNNKKSAMRYSNATMWLNRINLPLFVVADVALAIFVLFVAYKIMKIGG